MSARILLLIRWRHDVVATSVHRNGLIQCRSCRCFWCRFFSQQDRSAIKRRFFKNLISKKLSHHTRNAGDVGLWIVCLLMPLIGRAQEYRVAYQTWGSLAAQGNVHPNIALYIDLNTRFYDDFRAHQALFRPAIGLRLVDTMYLWLGYAWAPSQNEQHKFIDEHRIWEQWTCDLPGLPKPLAFFLRTRLEQRFRPGTSSDMGWRYRQLVRIRVFFSAGFPLYASVWNEVFFALNHAEDSGQRAWMRRGFDQNRVFVGPGWKVSRIVSIEFGYMNRIIRKSGPEDMRHVFAVNASVNVE